jgi:hypothetical protein
MIKIIFAFLFSIILGMNLNAQVINSAELSDTIISAFKTKEFTNFKKLLFDTSDYKEFVDIVFKVSHIPEEQKPQFLINLKLNADSANKKYIQDFDGLIIKGEKIGIDWNKISKAKFVYKKTNKLFLNAHLNFICKDSSFVFYGITMIKLTSGYKLTEIRTIRKGNIEEYINSDLLDDADK